MVAVYISLIIFVIVLSIWLYIFLVQELYQENIIRIEEANTSIEDNINKQFELLKKINDIIKEITNSEEDKIKIIDNIEELNNIELDKELTNFNEKLNKIVDNNNEFQENENYLNLELEFKKLRNEYLALKKYYNDTAGVYNKMVNSTPYKLVAHIKKYKELDIFSNEDILAK